MFVILEEKLFRLGKIFPPEYFLLKRKSVVFGKKNQKLLAIQTRATKQVSAPPFLAKSVPI
jgi:hypothetical protein